MFNPIIRLGISSLIVVGLLVLILQGHSDKLELQEVHFFIGLCDDGIH